MIATDRDEGWAGICAICGLSDTARCRRCPTRSKAFLRMALTWHDRHRLTLAWCAFGISTATVFQVIR